MIRYLTNTGIGFIWVFTLMNLLAEKTAETSPSGSTTNSWFELQQTRSSQFEQAAAQKIDPQKLDRELLDAAVFHETNRRRQQHELPPLRHHKKVRQMARIQSRAMAEMEKVTHDHPDPEKATLADRAHFVGLQTSFVAENVASAFGRDYDSGTPFYIREQAGRKVFSHKPDGPPIPMRSYASFAEALVEGWMQSPGHRHNLLHPAPEFLGCACEPAQEGGEMEKFYCTQVFFAPFELLLK